MNKFDNTDIDKGPERSYRELTFIMDEMFMTSRAILNGIIEVADPNDIIILSGAEIGIIVQDYTMTSGYAFHNDELFEIDSAIFTAAGGEVGIFVSDTIDVTLNFADTGVYKAREIRKLKLISGVSGTGLKDHDEVIRLSSLFRLDPVNQLLQTKSIVNPANDGGPNFPFGLTTASRLDIGNHIFDFRMAENAGSTIKLKITPTFTETDQSISGEILINSYNQGTGGHSIIKLAFECHRYFSATYSGLVATIHKRNGGGAYGVYTSFSVNRGSGEISINFSTTNNGTLTTIKFQGNLSVLKSNANITVAVSTV